MLNRRRKIQKYISALKKKHLKKFGLHNHQILKHKVQVKNELGKDAGQLPGLHGSLPLQIQYDQQQQHQQIEQQKQKPCWNDPDDQINQKEKIKLHGKNKFTKLKLGQVNNEEIVADEYERKLGKFYESRYKRFNWAKEANDVIEEKDINDYMNEDIYFSDKKQSKKSIKFQAKTVEHHESIISGLDWHKNVVFTCGLDHKLKVWHFLPQQQNPDLKLKQEKDIFVSDLPLSNCFYRDDGKVISGTLRKNIVLVDTQKWKPTFITSSFLKEHKTYQNLKISVYTNQTGIFSQNRISLLDKNSIYSGSLLANENVEDVCFGSLNSPHSIYAVSSDSFYEWDSRKLEIVRLEKKYLNFTSVSASPNSINIGSKLGSMYIYSTDFANPLENNNLVTDITHLNSNKDGTLTLALSKWKSNAVRIIDSLTGRALGDWPSVKTKIGLPMRGAFNEGNYFGVGNSHGYLSIYGFESQIL